ncbi:MAG: PD-(D/E)XK nuclease domain-containing protein [Bulleidia sp.]|nr:PD-(D/E)XK nuclease domain-containing protein [Bulleidia sp.]
MRFHSISYYDNKESFYHGFLTGILHGLNVESNREAGDGRFDICIIPSGSHNTGIVIERKHSKSAVDLPKDSRSAAEQIVERHYLQDSKLSTCRHTKGYGMAFHKKRCFVTGIDEL